MSISPKVVAATTAAMAAGGVLATLQNLIMPKAYATIPPVVRTLLAPVIIGASAAVAGMIMTDPARRDDTGGPLEDVLDDPNLVEIRAEDVHVDES